MKINFRVLSVAVLIDFGGSYVFQTVVGYITNNNLFLILVGGGLSISAGFYLAQKVKKDLLANAILLGICTYLLGCLFIFFGPGYTATDYLLLLLTPALNILGVFLGKTK